MAALAFEEKIPLIACLNFLEIFALQESFGFYQACWDGVVVFIGDGFPRFDNMAIHFDSCKHWHLFKLSIVMKLYRNIIFAANISNITHSFFSTTVHLVWIWINNVFIFTGSEVLVHAF